ncbi:MAG: hypothetical protein FJ039_04670 [Chloroflexi bacterium]|nr:hypothetical protein [Chloroflexota bacterium]
MKFTERELAKQPLTPDEIKRLSGGKPNDLIDRKKPSFRALGIGDKTLSDKEAIELMLKNPSIIRRPIYDVDGQIVLGVDEAKLKKLLG